MDFSKIDVTAAADKGALMHVEHPATREPLYDKAGKPITMLLAGQDSRLWKSEQAKISEKYAGRKKYNAASLQRDSIELLASVTLQWNGIEWEGKPLECNRENARMLYAERAWVMEQVDAFVAERANFFTSA